MKNENNIDNYFDRVKQNPPLMDIEKVRQVITEVKAKVKVEKEHRYYLKFLMMTTIFAVIISAILLWTNNKAEDFSREQTTMIQTQSDGDLTIYDNKTSVKGTIFPEKVEQQYVYKTDIDSMEADQMIVPNSSSVIDSNTLEYLDASAISKNNEPTYKDSTLKEAPSHNNLAEVEKQNNYTYPEQILDSTMFIELNRKELENLGFNFAENNIKLQFLKTMFTLYTDEGLIFGVEFDDDTLSHNKIPSKLNFKAESLSVTMNKKNNGNVNEGIVPMLVTNENGKELLKTSIPEADLAKMFSPLFPKDFRTLLPIVMRKNTFGNQPKEDLVYWFLPSDTFFNRLPKDISSELLGEYNYITAEDKSQLVKPECKYFDECKNTLKVSSFKVYPNPAHANATVSFTLPEAIEGRITLVDLSGRERQILQHNTNYSKGTHRFELDLSSVPEGIYLLTLYSDKGIQTQRLIVAR
ncbi:MAG: T9SS type A sorting domain-containing protein [Prolixibacteraceae bacterium]|nr:T9SS type A sorting domain-containing protein [Prolixibacteraceae bacterium]